MLYNVFKCFCNTSVRALKRPAQFVSKHASPGHLYIVREREFLKTQEPIYKIGKTTNIVNRMPKYPKSSRVIAILYCSTDIHLAEKRLITKFDATFVKRSDIGSEYYESEQEKDILFEFLNILLNEF